MKITKRLIEKVLPILKRHKAKRAAIFGSYARGEAGKKSDLDILVELPDNISLLGFIGIKQEIEEAIGKGVDLVEYTMIKPALKERILGEKIAIL